jgi:hypothetical protein
VHQLCSLGVSLDRVLWAPEVVLPRNDEVVLPVGAETKTSVVHSPGLAFTGGVASAGDEDTAGLATSTLNLSESATKHIVLANHYFSLGTSFDVALQHFVEQLRVDEQALWGQR